MLKYSSLVHWFGFLSYGAPPMSDESFPPPAPLPHLNIDIPAVSFNYWSPMTGYQLAISFTYLYLYYAIFLSMNPEAVVKFFSSTLMESFSLSFSFGWSLVIVNFFWGELDPFYNFISS